MQLSIRLFRPIPPQPTEQRSARLRVDCNAHPLLGCWAHPRLESEPHPPLLYAEVGMILVAKNLKKSYRFPQPVEVLSDISLSLGKASRLPSAADRARVKQRYFIFLEPWKLPKVNS